MKTTRRSILSTALLSGLCGCSAIRGQRNQLKWSARVGDDPIAEKIYVDDDRVAISTPTGRIALFRTRSGESVIEGRSREHLGTYAGTPPVAVSNLYLTFTDRVYAITKSGEVSWIEELPTDGFVSVASRPIVIDGDIYITTDNGVVLRVNPDNRSITELDFPPIPANWWNFDNRRAVIGTESLRTVVVDFTDKEVLWSRSGPPRDYPSFYNSDIITSTKRDDQLIVQRVDPDASEIRWNTPIPGTGISFSGQLSSETIAVVSRYPWEREEPSHATLIDAASGEITDSYELAPRTNSSGEISQGSLFLTSVAGDVVSINTESGLTQHIQSESQISSPATVHNGWVFFATNEGEIRSHSLDL